MSRKSLQGMNMSRKIALIGEDGIGREVIPAALDVVCASGAAVDFTELDWGAERTRRRGSAATAPLRSHICQQMADMGHQRTSETRIGNVEERGDSDSAERLEETVTMNACSCRLGGVR